MATASDLPPYPPERILNAPFPERVRLACLTWAAQIAPNSVAIMAMYWAKYIFLFIGGWAFWVSFSKGYPGFGAPLEWATADVAFQKFVVWAILYEILGLGCSSGPMNARFSPPLGGFLYFLRPGTTKLALFPKAPIVGGITRSWIDVGSYALTLVLLVRVLVAGEVTADLLWPIAVMIPVLGVFDKTLFLAARAEHYWVAAVCLTVATADRMWLPACKVVWGFIWFWAATSKINHHFPSVIMVMMNNGPFFPKWLKKHLMVSYPDDPRPSRFASAMAKMGTATEYAIPFVLILSPWEPLTYLMLAVMMSFHGFIAINNPAGMPIEWNILMIYGGIFLFGVNFDPGSTSILALGGMPLLAVFLFFCLVAVPTFGNFVPSKVSFLLAMRYYAGNWAYNVWLFRGDSWKKLAKLKKPAGVVREQLATLLPDEQMLEVAVKTMLASRFLHMEGRPLLEALPHAVDDIEQYEWMEGEVLGGIIVGWNFGDGHLNGEQLMNAVHEQCGFEEGELRVLSVESQPLFGPTMHWRVYDAVTGLVAEGKTKIADMLEETPWPSGKYAEALRPGRAGTGAPAAPTG